jgi:hypothetical protein
MATSSATYIRAYQALGDELKRLPTVHTPARFFVEYARLLLDIVESFSTEDNWKRLPGYLTIPPPGNRGHSSAVDFSGEKYEGIKKKLGLSDDADYMKRRLLPRSEQHVLFRAEIDKVERENSAHYEWFVLFSSRVIFSAMPDRLQHRLGHFPINTGFSEYGALIAHWRLWTSEGAFRRFQELIGDDVTLKMRTPLALVRAFPASILIPYPFKLSEEDLIQFTSIYPVRDANVIPLGFPFVSEEGDEKIFFSPDAFNLHDAHHFAVLRLGYASFASQSATPLDLERIKEVYLHIKEQQLLYSQAVHRLQLFIEDDKLTDPSFPIPNFYKHLFFEFFHEGTHGVRVRLQALVDPDYCLYTKSEKERSFSDAQRFFPESTPSELMEHVLAKERHFKQFVQEILGSSLFEKIRKSQKVPLAGINFTAFGRYTFDFESPRAISVHAAAAGEPIPSLFLDAETLDMYTSHADIYYYFFPSIEEKAFDSTTAMVIRLRKKPAADSESKSTT